ncbi:hypothetical protein [Cohnella sp. GbtcB17]|uniref:RNA dependent RNA polymerase n=1 Tax=Cohnella sp. GbtcB17 TaxID=2824762 RepID=UPI0034D713ED
MSLHRQIFMYGLDTGHFYTPIEQRISRRMHRTRKYMAYLKSAQNLGKRAADRLAFANDRLKRLKEQMKQAFAQNVAIRKLDAGGLKPQNVIGVFESALTRTLGIARDTLTEDLFVIQTYYLAVLEDLILNGFMHGGNKYVCFTASAGQIRSKKTLFIRESLLLQHQMALSCGLTTESINRQRGINSNKYLAYLALCATATEEWPEFDIDKAIVVDDLQTAVRSLADHIDIGTYEIRRTELDIPFTHTDGCGMILPRLQKRSMMVRLPWIKGLLVPFPFDKFIREHRKSRSDRRVGIVKDIYGQSRDILKEGIEVIFTKSQFKMWNYYQSWQQYQRLYRTHGCRAGKCNEEEERLADAKLNYQMLQTLTSLSDDELLELSAASRDLIVRLGTDKTTMLKVLGVVDSNTDKNYYQQALEIYPELLSDTYSKEILKQVKKSKIKAAKSGKLDVDGKYTYICPDLYAFCQRLFLGEARPSGLLEDGEVFCSLYDNETRLDCLRAPHLYREHAVRTNKTDKEKKRWFVTKGLYTSCRDAIGKLLMFDNDGDKSLVCAEATLVKAAERDMRDIVPLYYEMAKADAQTINARSIYEGIRAAYTGGNIGSISNEITKIWNSPTVDLDVIKWLCMENNFTIDYAKTLYKLERPEDKHEQINSYGHAKLPHFFKYAKDKQEHEIEPANQSVIDRLGKLIPNVRIQFSAAQIGKLDYRLLMSKPDREPDAAIIEAYAERDLKKHFFGKTKAGDGEDTQQGYLYVKIRKELLEINDDIDAVVDVLVAYLYGLKQSSYKTTLWSSFGDILVRNLKKNVPMKLDDGHIMCESCGERIIKTSRNQKKCEPCAAKANREQTRERMRIKRRTYV